MGTIKDRLRLIEAYSKVGETDKLFNLHESVGLFNDAVYRNEALYHSVINNNEFLYKWLMKHYKMKISQGVLYRFINNCNTHEFIIENINYDVYSNKDINSDERFKELLYKMFMDKYIGTLTLKSYDRFEKINSLISMNIVSDPYGILRNIIFDFKYNNADYKFNSNGDITSRYIKLLELETMVDRNFKLNKIL